MMFGMDSFGLQTLLFALSWLLSSAQILDVRLVDGDSDSNGRVEINVEGVGWRSHCGTSWDMNDVIVTCRQMGFSGAQLDLDRAEFGIGTLPIHSKSLLCKGNEETLNDCSMRAMRCGGGSSNKAGAICHGHSYIGCYGDNPQNRLLKGASYQDQSGMTIDLCTSFCMERGFELVGLELGSECYCGDQNANYEEYGREDDSECRHTCTGNNLETCGGIAKMAIHTTVPPTSTTTQMESSSLAKTPGDLEGTSTSVMPPSSTTSSEVARQTQPQPIVAGTTDNMMQTIVYVLGVLLLFCIIVIISCLAWNCKLRHRLRSSYHVSSDHHHTPSSPHTPGGVNGLPYMSLSERRTDDNNGYQSLSVQRKDAQQKNLPGSKLSMDEGPYASSLGDPVYQEPNVYMEPDNMCSVSFTTKPGESNADELLGGGNEYETLGT